MLFAGAEYDNWVENVNYKMYLLDVFRSISVEQNMKTSNVFLIPRGKFFFWILFRRYFNT